MTKRHLKEICFAGLIKTLGEIIKSEDKEALPLQDMAKGKIFNDKWSLGDHVLVTFVWIRSEDNPFTILRECLSERRTLRVAVGTFCLDDFMRLVHCADQAYIKLKGNFELLAIGLMYNVDSDQVIQEKSQGVLELCQEALEKIQEVAKYVENHEVTFLKKNC